MDSLISRQAAIDLVRDVCNAIMSECSSHYDEETGDEVFDDILEVDAILKCNKEVKIALKHMPSAQSERKTGKWIVYYECPKCGEITKDFMEYCPFCDADMRGEQDG